MGDSTAVCVVEGRGNPRPLHLVRYLPRLPLGMPYPAMPRHVLRMIQTTRERACEAPTVYVNVTGVGTPL